MKKGMDSGSLDRSTVKRRREWTRVKVYEKTEIFHPQLSYAMRLRIDESSRKN